MKNPAVAAVLALAILITGCIQGQVQDGALQAPAPEGGFQPDAGEMEKLDTANLSFERNVSGVMNPDTELFQRPVFSFSRSVTENGSPLVYYFYSSGCSACKALRPEIDRMQGSYPGVSWLEYDIATQNGTWAYQDFSAEYGLNESQKYVPQVLVNGTIITDRFNINRSLEGILIGLGPSS